MKEANETAMMFADDITTRNDKALFVSNLGWLLSQTRDGVVGCELITEYGVDEVRVHYKNGASRDINIDMDSYGAIIRDVAKNYQ